jgi:hypothetical protein
LIFVYKLQINQMLNFIVIRCYMLLGQMLRVGARGTRTQGSSFLSSSRFTGVTAAAAARFCPAARSQTLGLVGRYSSSTTTTAVEGGKLTQEEVDNQNKHANVLRLVNAYRTYGHFDAALDPLGRRQRGYHHHHSDYSPLSSAVVPCNYYDRHL